MAVVFLRLKREREEDLKNIIKILDTRINEPRFSSLTSSMTIFNNGSEPFKTPTTGEKDNDT